eukprot:scaffold20925_cov199-Skeletonema_menzelii.AAC.1
MEVYVLSPKAPLTPLIKRRRLPFCGEPGSMMQSLSDTPTYDTKQLEGVTKKLADRTEVVG